MAENERIWFRFRFAGEDIRRLYWSPDQPQGEIDLAAADSAEADFAIYATEVAEARMTVSGHALHERFVYGTQGQPERDLRWVYVHMIEEYARHNGHADLIRGADRRQHGPLDVQPEGVLAAMRVAGYAGRGVAPGTSMPACLDCAPCPQC
jgi:hypothetical protein